MSNWKILRQKNLTSPRWFAGQWEYWFWFQDKSPDSSKYGKDPQILKWVVWTSNNSGAKIKIWSKSAIREKCKDLQQWRRYSGREVFGLLMKVSILWWMALAESAARSGREHSATGFQAKAREPHLLLITKVHNPNPNYALFLTHCNALPFSALLFRTLAEHSF